MSNQKFTILTDMDDVMEDLCKNWLELLKFLQRNNPDYIHKSDKDLKSWDITKHFPMLTVDEVFAPLNTDIIFDLIRPLPNSVEILKKWNDLDDVNLYILTSSHYSSIAPKRAFLKKYFPYINWNQVIISPKKQMIKGDILIDDYEGNLIGGDYSGILFYQPHNASFDVSQYSNITRAKDWKDVDGILEQKYNEFKKGRLIKR